MTTTNWLFVCAISIMAAGGFFGLGSWGMVKIAKPKDSLGGACEPESHVGSLGKLHSQAEADQADKAKHAGASPAVATIDVEGKFNAAFGHAKLGVTFEVFRANPESLRNKLPQADQILSLKDKLNNPTKGFEVTAIDQKILSEFIQPTAPESFKINDKGNEMTFVWVENKGKGFWCNADETTSEPPPEFYLVKDGAEDVKLKYRPRQPVAEEWLAACSTPGIEYLDKPLFGKGEYLADGKVIGPSDRLAEGNEWMVPCDAAKRIVATTEKVAVAPPARSAVNLLSIELAKAHGEKAMDANAPARYVGDAEKQLTEKARAAAALNADKETFAYRIVIDPAQPHTP